MADFAHLAATMTSIKKPKKAPSERRKSGGGVNGQKSVKNGVNGNGGEKKKKKKKKSVKSTADGTAVEKKPQLNEDGTVKKKKKKRPSQGGSQPGSRPNSRPPSPPAAVKKQPKSLTNRLGPVITQPVKVSKAKKEILKVQVDTEREKKSKIWQALNPQSLYIETEEEKAAKANKEMLEVRGGFGVSVMQMEDSQYERDEFGNLVIPDEEDEEITGFGGDGDEEEEEEEDLENLADFDPEIMQEMLKRRQEREAEAQERRKLLRRKSIEIKKKENAKKDKIIKEIEAKEAKLKKKKEIDEKEVIEAQNRLTELSFDFGFH